MTAIDATITDDQLIPLLLAYDDAAINFAVSKYHRQMHYVAKSIVGEKQADDVTQEAWMSVFKSLAKFQQKSSLKTWILRIVANEAKSTLRKDSRNISLEAITDNNSEFMFDRTGHWQTVPAQWHDESPDSLVQQEELQDCIEKTVAELPQVQQAVFNMRDVECMALDEICNILDLSSSNTRVLIHRARAKMLKMIDHFQETGTC